MIAFNVLVNNNQLNVGAFDLEDDTFGQTNTIVGNGGTANFYLPNFFGTTNTSSPIPARPGTGNRSRIARRV